MRSYKYTLQASKTQAALCLVGGARADEGELEHVLTHNILRGPFSGPSKKNLEGPSQGRSWYPSFFVALATPPPPLTQNEFDVILGKEADRTKASDVQSRCFASKHIKSDSLIFHLDR